MKIAKQYFFIALILANTSCYTIVGAPVEVRLEGVGVEGESAVRKMIGVAEHEPMLRVEFVSETNLMYLAKKKEMNIGYDVSLCDDGIKINRWPHIYYAGSVVSISKVHSKNQEYLRAQQNRSSPNGLYHYYLFFDYRFHARHDNQDSYDLTNLGENVCLTVRGGSMLPLNHFRANTLVIPAKEIAKAVSGHR